MALVIGDLPADQRPRRSRSPTAPSTWASLASVCSARSPSTPATPPCSSRRDWRRWRRRCCWYGARHRARPRHRHETTEPPRAPEPSSGARAPGSAPKLVHRREGAIVEVEQRLVLPRVARGRVRRGPSRCPATPSRSHPSRRRRARARSARRGRSTARRASSSPDLRASPGSPATSCSGRPMRLRPAVVVAEDERIGGLRDDHVLAVARRDVVEVPLQIAERAVPVAVVRHARSRRSSTPRCVMLSNHQRYRPLSPPLARWSTTLVLGEHALTAS